MDQSARSRIADSPLSGVLAADPLRLLVDAVTDRALCVLTTDGLIASWNGGAERFTGYRADEVIGRHYSCLFPPEDVAAGVPQRALDHALVRGRFENEMRRVGKDGVEHAALMTITPLRDETGRHVGFANVTRDTAQPGKSRASSGDEEAAQERQRLLSGIVDSAMDGIITVDEQQRIVLFNSAAEYLFGCPASEAIGQRLETFIPERFRAAHAEYVRAYGRTNVTSRDMGHLGVVYGLRADGSEIPLEASISHTEVSGRDLYSVILRDVSERLQAESGLREKAELQERLARIVATAPGMLCTFRMSPDGLLSFPYAPPSIESIFGVPPERLADDASILRSLVHPDDIERVRTSLAQSSEHLTVWHQVFRVRPPGMGELWIEGRATPQRTPDGGTLWHGFLLDITSRKQSERELARFVSLSPVVIFAMSLDQGRPSLTWASENLVNLTGFTPAEARGEDWWRGRLHPEDSDRVLVPARWPHDIDHQILEFRFRRKDDQYVWIRDERRLLRDAAGEPLEIVGSWSDVTERIQLEDQLRQAMKMDAVGQLAGGVAHDFNNLLTVITGYTDLLLASVAPDDPNRVLLSDIHDAGERAAGLTRQLLAFSRKQRLEPMIVDVNETVSNIDKMLRRLIGEDIILTVVLAPQVSAVVVDPGQLEQVLMNLAINARDAMPRGGRLTVETRDVFLTEDYCRTHPESRPGRYVLLSVTDTGIGMTAEVKARIFEPFYTTKRPGKGTGLGLATTFGIVKQSGGQIEVYSEVGLGTCFKIYLPALADANAESLVGETPAAAREGTETVLLVEDDESVRRLAKLILETHGYEVVEARSGREAVALADRRTAPIHLVLTDLVMPEVSGRELADRLMARHKELKVLFMSGYIDDAVVRHGLIEAQEPFIHKPFAPIALATKVRYVLDS